MIYLDAEENDLPVVYARRQSFETRNYLFEVDMKQTRKYRESNRYKRIRWKREGRCCDCGAPDSVSDGGTWRCQGCKERRKRYRERSYANEMKRIERIRSRILVKVSERRKLLGDYYANNPKDEIRQDIIEELEESLKDAHDELIEFMKWLNPSEYLIELQRQLIAREEEKLRDMKLNARYRGYRR